MTNAEKALQLHKEWNGKFETTPKMSITTREDLALAYTPGVAEPCKVIAKDKEAAYTYTIKSNTIAVVSDGSAVLGPVSYTHLIYTHLHHMQYTLFWDYTFYNHPVYIFLYS